MHGAGARVQVRRLLVALRALAGVAKRRPLSDLAQRWQQSWTSRTLWFLPQEDAMPVLTASEARANLYRLIDQTAESHEPIVIAGKRASAVLVSTEDWQAMQETMHLLSIPGMRKSIRDAMAEPLAKSSKEPGW
jgi:antitoxin YefM